MDDARREVRSGSEKRQRSIVRQMRCTANEDALLAANAERAGMAVGAFMRMQSLGSAGPRAARRPPVERAALAQILAQLGKCGSNLNQIAHVLNKGGAAPTDIPEAISEFREACAVIMRVLRKTPA
jgi:hypothetical protein